MKANFLFLVLIIFGIQVIAANNKLNWKFETQGRIYSSPLIDGHLLFFGSGDSCFYAVNKTTGKKAWDFRTKGAIHSSPETSGKMVYFGSADGYLYALNKISGRLIWKFKSEGEKMLDMWDYYLSSPKCDDGIVYWGSGDGHLYALDCISGILIWKFQSGNMIHATPVISDNKVYIGNYNGNFYALNCKDGIEVWKFKTVGDTYFPKGEVQKGAAIDSGVVYFGSRDYNIYALDTKTGTEHWNMKEHGSWIIATPLVYKENIYFGTSDTHRFYCINKNSGEVAWKITLPMRVYGSAIAYKEIIYFGCFDGKLRGVDAKTGESKWEFQTDASKQNYNTVYGADGKFRAGFELYGNNLIESERIIHTLGSILSTPAIDNQTIYFGSSDGALYSVKLN